MILLGMGFRTYRNWAQMREDLGAGSARATVCSRPMQLISRVTDAETGQRGYLLTGSDEYLVPYEKASRGYSRACWIK